MKYSDRAKLCTNPTAIKLLNLMDEKQTNLSVDVNLTKKAELLALADAVGPEICVLKTHIDIVEDFDADLTEQLKKLAQKHNFLIFEDRKFADTGNTVKHQYRDGIYHIASWADITNAHAVPGPGVIAGLKEIGLPFGRGLLLLAEMSTEGTLATGEYTKKTIEMAQANKDFVIGFITRHKLLDDPTFINLTPGVKLVTGTDGLGQQWITPEDIIHKQGCDIIIAGRGVYQAPDPLAEAKKYRGAGWEAYQKRLNS
jgi:orotidine 5'-phosphate decarboxylase subfamily 1